MESLQFVGCSWFIGLIGLGFRFTRNKSTETELCAHPCPFPVSSSTHIDAPGVHSLALCFLKLQLLHVGLLIEKDPLQQGWFWRNPWGKLRMRYSRSLLPL